jgi:hypothetical protein
LARGNSTTLAAVLELIRPPSNLANLDVPQSSPIAMNDGVAAAGLAFPVAAHGRPPPPPAKPKRANPET